MSTSTSHQSPRDDQPRPIVAITGLNGYIATHVAIKFLHEGWDIKGSVRSSKSAGQILGDEKHVLAPYVKAGRVGVVEVPDLGGDLGELLEDVQAVAHIAAPLPIKSNPTWEEFKTPTIAGTLNLLEHANKSKSIKSITVMSSFGAMINLAPVDQQWNKVYNEHDWNPYDEDLCSSIDPASNEMAPHIWYMASKKYLEFAVNHWVEENKPAWPVAVFCPPMVFRAALNSSTPDDLNNFVAASGHITHLIKGKNAPIPPEYSLVMVDPRDVATAFFNAVERKKAGRYALAGHSYTYRRFVDTFRRLRPDLEEYFAAGDPAAAELPPDGPHGEKAWTIDASKSIKELGLQCE
ncbi:hypothetical protein I316_07275 [Kwoniella heveanensis BCC8398]|uniref:Thioester reductase (TE) domain-containing protein n=1 Tax=Kwoniella heveanensis BCC8398 TaxID=1296120 RepID=A0A1B9GIT9_9TREE|nr:hypothetical protein I316_07275 [Kwoniella heveanensis BCC8398]